MSSDPRVFFAAERTLLAWVRSGITVIALGFVVAKFGMFLTLVSATSPTLNELPPSNFLSNVFGIVLVIIGAIITLGAQLNHYYYVKTLPPKDVPKLAISWLSSLLTFLIALIGILLGFYLAFV